MDTKLTKYEATYRGRDGHSFMKTLMVAKFNIQGKYMLLLDQDDSLLLAVTEDSLIALVKVDE